MEDNVLISFYLQPHTGDYKVHPGRVLRRIDSVCLLHFSWRSAALCVFYWLDNIVFHISIGDFDLCVRSHRQNADGPSDCNGIGEIHYRSLAERHQVPQTGDADAGNGGFGVLRLSAALQGANAVDHHRAGGVHHHHRLWEVLQHPVLLPHHVSHQFRRQSDTLQHHELQISGRLFETVRFEEYSEEVRKEDGDYTEEYDEFVDEHVLPADERLVFEQY